MATCKCCRCCCGSTGAREFWSQIFDIMKKGIPVVIMQIIGWAVFSYVEDSLSIIDCFVDNEVVADKLYPQSDEMKKAIELFTRLNHKTKLQPSYNQSVAIYALFQSYFKVPAPVHLSKMILGYRGCLKWYRFSVMTMTTIGFGSVTPKTKLGKMLVIPYALVTIPLMLSLLASFGTIASSWAEGIMLLVHRLTRGNKPLRYRLIKRCFYLYIVVWIVGAFFYSVAATSPYVLDTFYFIQVTFSTVGFGDILGPANKIEFYIYWLFFGLAAFSGFADSILAAAPRVKFGIKRGNTFFCFHYIEDEELEGFSDTSPNRNNDSSPN